METFIYDKVRISLITNIVLTGLTTKIKFRRPDGTTGSWDAVIDGTDNTKMYHDTDINDLNVPGYWHLQAFVEAAGVRSHGKVVELKVHEILTDIVIESTTLLPTTLVPTTPAP